MCIYYRILLFILCTVVVSSSSSSESSAEMNLSEDEDEGYKSGKDII